MVYALSRPQRVCMICLFWIAGRRVCRKIEWDKEGIPVLGIPQKEGIPAFANRQALLNANENRGRTFCNTPVLFKRARFFLFLFKWSSFSRKEKFSSFIECFFPFFSAYYLCLQRNLLNKSTNVKRAMRNENLLSFLLIKRRILKLLAIKYAYSLIVLCGISFMACSDDDPVKRILICKRAPVLC